MSTPAITVAALAPANAGPAAGLLERFFREEGFDTPFNRIAASLDMMLADGTCWAALAMQSGEAVGVVTVTTMLFVEWGRLGEIGDLYVAPEWRGRGAGRALIEAALTWCLVRGCSAVSVVITPEGESRHGLSKFYRRHEFDPSGRTIMTRTL